MTSEIIRLSFAEGMGMAASDDSQSSGWGGRDARVEANIKRKKQDRGIKKKYKEVPGETTERGRLPFLAEGPFGAGGYLTNLW
ncbi:hypothetical protein TNCV_3747211 [Trichonephila clavipes]|nr:hypothetical protein TNCV_3747211 [Trichonephila clavipes]